MNCPICNTSGTPTFQKSGQNYTQCSQCGCCYVHGNIPQDIIITENDSDEARNHKSINLERLRRIEERQMPKLVLDFGCGKGQMIDLIKSQKSYLVDGIDKGTKLQLADMLIDSVDTIIMTEVIEHIDNPIWLFHRFNQILKDPGIIYIESSFIDFLGKPEDSGYVDPRIGHSLVHSKKSIELLGKQTGFRVSWYSPNVVFFIKEL